MHALLRCVQAVVIVTSILIVTAVAALVLVPRAFGWTTLVILSGSMEPAMPVGGLAFVEPVAPSDISAGDVVTYPRPDQPDTLVSHRVLAVSDQLGQPTLWTKGDANEAPDRWAVPNDAVVGRVRYSLPYLGTASQHLRTPQGFFVVIALPGVAIIVTELARIAATIRRARAHEASTVPLS